MRSIWPALAILLVVASACAQQNGGSTTGGTTVLATTTVLADITRNVAGDRLVVETLLPPGTDPHSFEPTPADLVKISESAVLIMNGAGYESFLARILDNTDQSGLVIDASSGLPMAEGGQGGDAPDPHLWLDPHNVIAYIHNIEAGLSATYPDSADVFAANATAYIDQLQELDTWIEEQVSMIPPQRRLLVTNHEALQYFADRYGFQVVATALRSVSSDAAVSAGELGQVVDEIRASSAPAIFLDEIEDSRLATQISEETGVIIVDDLHLESLTAGPPAATYLDMMRHNASRIVDALVQ
jgi:ABC-type Zn uptake system ZnuABC Zn-binding protein ZnuA